MNIEISFKIPNTGTNLDTHLENNWNSVRIHRRHDIGPISEVSELDRSINWNLYKISIEFRFWFFKN